MPRYWCRPQLDGVCVAGWDIAAGVGILELAKDEAQPDFKKHTRGYLLHNTEPMGPMTEEEAIEYLIQKDVPQSVWQSWDEGNRPKMVICRKEQLPATREWRNAWRISDELAA